MESVNENCPSWRKWSVNNVEQSPSSLHFDYDVYKLQDGCRLWNAVNLENTRPVFGFIQLYSGFDDHRTIEEEERKARDREFNKKSKQLENPHSYLSCGNIAQDPKIRS